MKRTIYLLLVICVASALAGWVAARVRVSYLQREAAEKERLARLAAEKEAKRPAKYLAGLVRAADEIVIADMNGHGPGWLEYRLSDKVRLSQLADILGDASYQATAHGMWIKSREIRIYQMHEEVLALMGLNGYLHVFGKEHGGDFIVGKKTTDAIEAFAEEIKPDPTRVPTAGNASQDNDSSSARGAGSSSQDAVYNRPTFSDQEQEFKFYKEHAYKLLGGRMKVPNRYYANVEVQGDDIVVTFPTDDKGKDSNGLPLYPQADYRAKVRFNEMTGKVVEILVGP